MERRRVTVSIRKGWRPWLAWLAVCVLWGTTGPGIHIAVRSIPPFLMGGTRFVVAGAVLVGVQLLRGRRLPKDRRTWIELAVVSVLLTMANGLFGTAFLDVTGTVGTLVGATVAIWMSLIEACHPGGQKPGIRAVVGLVLGFSGVLVLMPLDGTWRWSQIGAYVLLLLSSLSWSYCAVFQRRRRFSERMEPLTSAGLQLLVTGILMCVVGLAMGEAGRWNPTKEGMYALAYLTVFGSLIGYASFIYMLEKLQASVVGIYTYINPLVAAIVELAIFDEPLGMAFLPASGLIMLGVWFARADAIAGRRRT